ncbi:MAG: hypothetical protein H6619_05745, partial [Deltaproteobacteria bacterium]|nr:hypothetical protein [Deltaproteobacteria bacterium]
RWLHDDKQSQAKFLRINSQSGVKTRRFTQPYDNILALNGLENRAAQFETIGTQMLVEAIEKTLQENNQAPEDIGALVFTSCSVPLIPSIDAAAILKSSLSPEISRVPIYQHGCAGGVIGLSLGAKLSKLGKPVIVSSVELCSLVFQRNNHSGAHLVGAAIFADGAAATIVGGSASNLSIVDSQSYLLPNSRHLMGYDIFDDGFHLRLDRALPSMLVKEAPKIVNSFLAKHDKEVSDINFWLFHPGGIKILDFLMESFSLSHEQCHWSYDVLRDFGNLSSTTIHYVLDSFQRDDVLKPGQNALIMGIGPGLTVELILLEHVDS